MVSLAMVSLALEPWDSLPALVLQDSVPALWLLVGCSSHLIGTNRCQGRELSTRAWSKLCGAWLRRLRQWHLWLGVCCIYGTALLTKSVPRLKSYQPKCILRNAARLVSFLFSCISWGLLNELERQEASTKWEFSQARLALTSKKDQYEWY